MKNKLNSIGLCSKKKIACSVFDHNYQTTKILTSEANFIVDVGNLLDKFLDKETIDVIVITRENIT